MVTVAICVDRKLGLQAWFGFQFTFSYKGTIVNVQCSSNCLLA